MSWQVIINGDAADLGMLAESLKGPNISITEDHGKFVLSGEEFEGLRDAKAVRAKASEIVTALSAGARLRLGSHIPIQLGAVVEVTDDGARKITLLAEPGKYSVRTRPATIKVTRSDSTVEIKRPADALAGWTDVALRNPAVGKALRLRNKRELSWGELCRLYEVITEDMPESEILHRDWVTKAQIGNLKHTANSVAATGDEARHGKEKTQPPANPMRLSDARALIDRLLENWLDHRAQNP